MVNVKRKTYVANVDIMIGDRFECTIPKYVFDNGKGVNEMLSKLFQHILIEKPYLKRRDEFNIIWNEPNGAEVNITFQPKKDNPS